jgi:hypothetical protein
MLELSYATMREGLLPPCEDECATTLGAWAQDQPQERCQHVHLGRAGHTAATIEGLEGAGLVLSQLRGLLACSVLLDRLVVSPSPSSAKTLPIPRDQMT